MEIKYTSDGKKVVVIGNLNSQEKIVQEDYSRRIQDISKQAKQLDLL